MKPVVTAVLLSACAPVCAQPALDEFVDVQWETHRVEPLGLTLTIPYHWEIGPAPIGDPIWFASDSLGSPSLGVSVLPAPPGLTLEASARAAAGGLPGRVEIVDERSIDLNGVPAQEITLDLDVPLGAGVALRSRLVSVLRDGQWILLNATDGRPASGFLEPLETALYSATFEPATVEGADDE